MARRRTLDRPKDRSTVLACGRCAAGAATARLLPVFTPLERTTMHTQFPAPATPGTMAAVAAVDLVKVYGSGDTAVRALDGVTVGFAGAAFTAIMGPSGSGKSTLMHCLAGLDTATSGRAL